MSDHLMSPQSLDPARTPEELAAALPLIESSPKDVGTVTLVVARPAEGERDVLAEGVLDLVGGLVGDNWSARSSKRTDDGGPHPDMQLNVINHRLIDFLAYGDRARQALAGDQLHLDLDLSHDNLPAGSRLTFSRLEGPQTDGPQTDGPQTQAVIEVTDQPHTGCAKFVARFGAPAMKFVNGPVGRPLRLRGLNAKVVLAGTVRPGDTVTVTRP